MTTLTTALKKTRATGANGLGAELGLRRRSAKPEDDGKTYRPDVVNLEGKHIVIDSKVSLNAYTDYVNAETDEERTQASAAIATRCATISVPSAIKPIRHCQI